MLGQVNSVGTHLSRQRRAPGHKAHTRIHSACRNNARGKLGAVLGLVLPKHNAAALWQFFDCGQGIGRPHIVSEKEERREPSTRSKAHGMSRVERPRHLC